MKKEKLWKTLSKNADSDGYVDLETAIETKKYRISFEPIFMEYKIQECEKCSAFNVCDVADRCPGGIIKIVSKETSKQIFIKGEC